MKKKVLFAFFALLLIFAGAIDATAAFISGDITFTGYCVPDNHDLTLATAFTSFSSVEVEGASGDYSPLAGRSASFNLFSWNPATVFSIAYPLWSALSAGGNTYIFVPSSLTYDSGKLGLVSFLTIAGEGTAYVKNSLGENVFDPTFGYYDFTATSGRVNASFSSTAATVPLPGALWLLAFGLSTLFGLRKKF